MICRRWDEQTQAFVPVEISDECRYYSTDMNVLVRCPGCGVRLRYGDTLPSQRYQTLRGFGYAVCPACHAAEDGRSDASDNLQRAPDIVPQLRALARHHYGEVLVQTARGKENAYEAAAEEIERLRAACAKK